MSETGTVAPQSPETPAAAATPAEKRKTIHLTRLSLQAPTPGVPGEQATLYWAVFDENPRIVVKTNDPNDKGEHWGKIVAALDPFDVGFVAQGIAQALSATAPFKMKIPKKNSYKNGQKFDKPTVINDVIVGKNAQGVIFISVFEQGRPDISFPLLPQMYTELIQGDGTPFPPDLASAMFATEYMKIVLSVLGPVMAHVAIEKSNRPWTPDQAKDGQQGQRPQQGQGGYQGNRQGGGGGGYQQRPGGGGGGYQNRQGGGGGGFNRGGQGGGFNGGNRQGGYQNNGGGNRQGYGGGQGGGNNYQGGGQNNQQQARPPAQPRDNAIAENIPDDNIPF